MDRLIELIAKGERQRTGLGKIMDVGHLREAAQWENLQAQVAELRSVVHSVREELKSLREEIGTLRRGLAGATSVMSVFVRAGEEEPETSPAGYADLAFEDRPRGILVALPSLEADSV